MFIFMLRISPVFPFPIINYVLGPVSTVWAYVIGSAIGLFPSNLLVTYFGTALSSVADMFNGTGMSTAKIVMLVVTSVLSVLLMIGISLYTKRMMNKIMAEEEMNEQVDEEADELIDIVNDINQTAVDMEGLVDADALPYTMPIEL